MNYETADDSFIATVDDIFSHASREKANSPISEDGEITPILIRRALVEVFGRKPTRMRVNKKQVRAYRGLKLKQLSQQSSVGMESPTDEWQTLVLHAKEIASGTWKVVKSTNTSVSFARFEQVRYNNQLVASEVCFTKKVEENRVETKIKYHEREVPKEVVCALDTKLNVGDCALKERAVLWMKFLDSSFVCHGFHADFEFADERIAKHHIITEDYDISEERAFSIRCEVLTNSAGLRCSKCSEEKKRLDKKISRRMLAKDKPLPPFLNHRYMTREQILEKLEREKHRRLSEEKQRERIQSQMLELEEEDHDDMVEIMSRVNKDDVPEDMLLFWDEQKKILQTESKSRYRWHPK